VTSRCFYTFPPNFGRIQSVVEKGTCILAHIRKVSLLVPWRPLKRLSHKIEKSYEWHGFTYHKL
jgi:hypothetical protein